MHLRTIKFEVGQLVVTPTAAAAIAENGVTLDALMQRHQSGDWGEISPAIHAVNERGISDQFNLQSGYALPDGRRVVIVTNRDRSATMVHLDAR
jgi:hypothetical protein